MFREVLEERWVRWSLGIAFLILILVKAPFMVFGCLFLCVGIYLLAQACIWGTSYLNHVLSRRIRKDIESGKWHSKWFNLEKISKKEQDAYEKMNDVKRKKRMKYASFSLPVLLIMFSLFSPNRADSDVKDPMPPVSNVADTKEEQKAITSEATVELELKDWYTSYSDKFNLKGKCTGGAKVEIYPVEKYPVKWENPTQTGYADEGGNFSFSIDTSKTVSFYVRVTKEGMKENHQPVSIDREYSEAEKIRNFVKEARTPKYNQLKKNPDNFSLTKAVYKGKVIQAMEEGGQTDLRISVSNLGYGIWSPSDVIYVTYDGNTPAAEDDIVTVYGTIMGKHTYKSQAGWDISVPLLVAEFIK